MIRRHLCQLPGDTAAPFVATPRAPGIPPAAPTLHQLPRVARSFLLLAALAVILVTAPRARAEEAAPRETEIRKTAREILEVERRLAGPLDARERRDLDRRRDLLEVRARSLAREELQADRRANEREDRDDLRDVRVFRGTIVPSVDRRERDHKAGGRDFDRPGDSDDDRHRDDASDDGDDDDEEDDDDEDEEDDEEEDDEEEEEEERRDEETDEPDGTDDD